MVAEPLDVEVAERFFGFTVRQYLDWGGPDWWIVDDTARLIGAGWTKVRDLDTGETREIYGRYVPRFSASMHDAANVIRELHRRGWAVHLILLSGTDVHCIVYRAMFVSFESFGASMPEAICKAALTTLAVAVPR